MDFRVGRRIVVPATSLVRKLELTGRTNSFQVFMSTTGGVAVATCFVMFIRRLSVRSTVRRLASSTLRIGWLR